MNLSIRITESNEGFAAFTVVSPIHTGNNSTIIHIGHVDEVHYVSTVVSDPEEDALLSQSALRASFVLVFQSFNFVFKMAAFG